MSKGIIVVDIEGSCGMCKMGSHNEYSDRFECFLEPTKELDDPDGGKPDWCPIQPMLEKIPHSEGEPWAEGWNSCIDELLKGGKQMKRLTAKRVNGIKEGYWSTAKKDELVQRLGRYEDTGLEPEEISKIARTGISAGERLPKLNHSEEN